MGKDVYEIYTRNRGAIVKSILKFGESHYLKSERVHSVSYTHLDVYKRQVLESIADNLCLQCTVNYEGQQQRDA